MHLIPMINANNKSMPLNHDCYEFVLLFNLYNLYIEFGKLQEAGIEYFNSQHFDSLSQVLV